VAETLERLWVVTAILLLFPLPVQGFSRDFRFETGAPADRLGRRSSA